MGTDHYDYIIIGGGISGLLVCVNLAKHKRSKILLLERLPRVGGKIHTDIAISGNAPFLMERGAARFHANQLNIMRLISQLGLTKDIVDYPSEITRGDDLTPLLFTISHNILNGDKKSMNDISFIDFVKKFEAPEVLQRLRAYTFYETLEFGNALYVATHILRNYGQPSYSTLREGMSSIIVSLSNILEGCSNVKVVRESHVSNIVKGKGGVIFHVSDQNTTYSASDIVMAIPGKYLSNFSLFDKYKDELNSIHYKTLNRTYALINKTQNSFDQEKIITMSRKLNTIKFFDNTHLLVSYCDGKCAKNMFKITSENKLDDMISQELTKLVRRTIKPKKTWSYYWPNSLGIWKPGADYVKIQQKMIHPMKHVFVCGDTFSSVQCWMEGAIETSLKVIELCEKQRKKYIHTKTRKLHVGGKDGKMYSMKDVRMHNKAEDGWIVIGNNVYDITTWIDKHPGGAIIKDYLGKDGSNAFKSIGHPDYVKTTILPKYFIGSLIAKTRKNQ